MKITYCSLIFTLFAGLCSVANAQGSFVVFGKGEAIPAEEKTVRPITAPYLHEDALITTDVRAWYIHHNLATLEGDVDVYALQVRLALTENFQLLAYKDGYSEFSDDNSIGLDNGWNDIGLGVKLALFQDVGSQFFISVGAGYEFGVGDDQVLQDTDEYRFWVSANKGFGKLHLGATANYIIAGDGKLDGMAGNSDLLTLHFHADYFLTEWLSPGC